MLPALSPARTIFVGSTLYPWAFFINASVLFKQSSNGMGKGFSGALLYLRHQQMISNRSISKYHFKHAKVTTILSKTAKEAKLFFEKQNVRAPQTRTLFELFFL